MPDMEIETARKEAVRIARDAWTRAGLDADTVDQDSIRYLEEAVLAHLEAKWRLDFATWAVQDLAIRKRAAGR